MISQLKIALFSFRTSIAKRRDFYEDFANAIREGEAPDTRLNKLILRERRRKNKGSAILYKHWLNRMKRMPFSLSLQGAVPDYELMVLNAAENDGRIEEAMTYLARSLVIQGKIKGAYVMAMISPFLAFLIIIGMLIANASMIGPMNLEIMPISRWPETTRQIYQLSVFVYTNWYLVMLAGIAFYFFLDWTKRSWVGKWRLMADNIPFTPWNSFRESQANAFLVSLALMLQSSSMGVKEALLGMRDYANPWLKWHIAQMQRRLSLSPNQPARALETGIFPTDMMFRIEDFCDRSSFQEGMKKMALEKAEYQIERAQVKAVIVSFVAIAFCAAFMLFFAMSQMQFGQAISNSVGK